ncbi:hypothetical protein DEI93_16030 [Curtobacterium sp. MCBD17_035]|uniref:hypothetical protein n=1 Tax=Curtobacterium sp. MCBD17_035 TaxID=2175673 RepID=UPI0011B61DBC|nr:hypothetical protein [Curtobacterium sp. MCBD17_035]WIB67438.1 hypothetical protein DEI93_16030 [Curtobacterium sp. MCBD17_035]
MSGSDPSVRRSAQPSGGPDECAIRFTTVLGSPNPDVVEDLDEGEILDIEKIDDPIRGVIAVRYTGETCGALTRDIALLRKCIDGGIEYEAEVQRLVGGSVTVEVRVR